MVEMFVGWLATFSLGKFIQERCESHLGDGAERGALAILKRFAGKRQDGSLPENHDLEIASGEALREATRALLYGIAAHLDPKPPLFDAIRKHLRDGTLFNQPLIELRDSPSRDWLNKLQELCKKNEPFERLGSEPVSADSNMTTLLQRRVDEDAQRALHQRFAAWMDRELQNVPGRPDFLDDFLQQGWPVEKDDNERVTLYQAWCLFFREKLKHKEEVFRVLVANTLVEVANDVTELREFAQQQPSFDEFHQWMGLRFGALQDWLDGRFNRLDAGQSKMQDTQGEHTEKLNELLKRTPLTPAQPIGKPYNIGLASIGSLFKGRDDNIRTLHEKQIGRAHV